MRDSAWCCRRKEETEGSGAGKTWPAAGAATTLWMPLHVGGVYGGSSTQRVVAAKEKRRVRLPGQAHLLGSISGVEDI